MLEVSALSLVRPGLRLGPASFALAERGCWWLLGDSGAGKSLLLESLAGFHANAQGSVRLDGREIGNLAPERRSVALMPQRWQLFPHWTAMRNLRFAAKLGGVGDHRIRELTRRLQVDHLLGRNPRALSGGESQRLTLAQTLLSPARVLLLDEPCSAIDLALQSSILELLLEECEKGGRICLLAAHRPIAAFPLCGSLRMEGCQLHASFASVDLH